MVCGLKPVKLAGVQSHGMILTAVESDTSKLGLLSILGTAGVEAGIRVAPKNSKVCFINRLVYLYEVMCDVFVISFNIFQVICQAKFDLKKQLPLLPFIVQLDGSILFDGLPLQVFFLCGYK